MILDAPKIRKSPKNRLKVTIEVRPFQRGEQRRRGALQEGEAGGGQLEAVHGPVRQAGAGQGAQQQHKVLLLRGGQRHRGATQQDHELNRV